MYRSFLLTRIPVLLHLLRMTNSWIFYFLAGPLTPAPVTLGSSSLPIEYIIPIIVEMRKASMTPVPTNSQKGIEISFFWQAGPAQSVTLRLLPLPMMVGEQAQPKRSCCVLSCALCRSLHSPWPEQFSVIFSQEARELKNGGRIPRTVPLLFLSEVKTGKSSRSGYSALGEVDGSGVKERSASGFWRLRRASTVWGTV